MIRLFVIGMLAFLATNISAQNTLNPSEKKDSSKTGKTVIKRQRTSVTAVYDSAYRARAKMATLEGIYIPKDLNDCFRELDKLMDDEVRQKFMAFSDEEVDRKTHKSLGIWLDHKWSISNGSRLSAYFNKMRVPHPEYMIGLIIQSYHRHLHEKDLKIKEQVLHFRKLWSDKQAVKAEKILEKNK